MSTIYAGMNKEERNKIIEMRCDELGILPQYDALGRAGYVPSLEDKIQFYENCEDAELREARGNALTEAMGDPEWDDEWREIF